MSKASTDGEYVSEHLRGIGNLDEIVKHLHQTDLTYRWLKCNWQLEITGRRDMIESFKQKHEEIILPTNRGATLDHHIHLSDQECKQKINSHSVMFTDKLRYCHYHFFLLIKLKYI